MATNGTGQVSVTMASTVDKKSPLDLCLDWIYANQAAVDRAEYGTNDKSVKDAIEEQSHKQKVIQSYQHEVDNAVKGSKEEDEKRLVTAYGNLKSLVDKKLHCLETMADISSMEEYCGNLHTSIDNKAVQMVDLDNRNKTPSQDVGDQLTGFISASSQDCIFAARDNWQWIARLVQCIEIHLKNAADYHQFFHEVDEVGRWLITDLKKLHDTFECADLTGTYADAKRLLQELDELKTAYNQWEAKVNHSWDKATKLVPVHLRTKATEENLACRSLCNYRTKEIDIREGEDLLLLDNSKSNMWKIQNCRGNKANIPALCVLIPGPFKEALEAAVRVRLQLLAAWTMSLKRIGKRLIYFMLLVFRQWDEDEIKLIESIKSPEREDLLRILKFIEETLGPHWQDYGGFVTLQERMLSTKMILEENAENSGSDPSKYQGLVVQISMLEKLMQKYRDLWKGWEIFKVILETSRQPDLMLIVDKWEQLQYVSTAYFTKFWQMGLPFEEFEKNMLEFNVANGEEGGSSGSGFDETIVKTTATGVSSAGSGMQNGGVKRQENTSETVIEGMIEEASGFEVTSATVEEVDTAEMSYGSEVKSAKTEQISSAEGEEQKKFIIKSVIDPRDNSEISMQQAIMLGILNPSQGIYVNPNTGETMPIPAAMTEGLILVEFTTTRRAKEKTSSVGIITVKTSREKNTPYKIQSVKDIKAGETLTPEEARKRKILNEGTGMFTNTRTHEEMLIADAIQKGYIEADRDQSEVTEDVESKTYAVRAVVDQRARKTISFQEAVARGIIDKESGAYYNNKTNEKMYVGDAIMRGFLKARVVDDSDTAQLDINPENKMVVEKTQLIKKKLLKPLHVLTAMRKATAAAAEKK